MEGYTNFAFEYNYMLIPIHLNQEITGSGIPEAMHWNSTISVPTCTSTSLGGMVITGATNMASKNKRA